MCSESGCAWGQQPWLIGELWLMGSACSWHRWRFCALTSLPLWRFFLLNYRECAWYPCSLRILDQKVVGDSLSPPPPPFPFCPVFLLIFFSFCFLSRRMSFETGLCVSSTSSPSLLFILCLAGFPTAFWTLHPSTLPSPLPFAGEQICHTPHLQIHRAWLICLIYNWCLN